MASYSKTVKVDIVKSVLKSVFDEKFKPLCEEKLALANRIYNDKFTPELVESLKSLPELFTHKSSALCINVRGEMRELTNSGTISPAYSQVKAEYKENFNLKLEERVKWLVPSCRDYEIRRFLTFPADSQICIDFVDLEERTDSLLKEYNDLAVELHTVVFSVGSVKQLLKVWPEAKDHIPVTEKKSKELTVQTKNLNEKIKSLKAA